MEDLNDPEEMFLCPYNSSHRIRRCRMTFHLVKCRKQHPEQKLIPCDFNATHMVAEPELKYHHLTCPDRKAIEAPILESQNKNENRFPIPNLNCESDENWDHVDVPTYNPQAYAEKSNVLRHLDIESGAKRKNFRLNERQRLGSLMHDTASAPQTERKEDRVQLPAHRTVVTTEPGERHPAAFRDKLKSETDKVFLQDKK